MDTQFFISILKKIFKYKVLYGLLCCLVVFTVYILYSSSPKEDALKSTNQTVFPSHVLCILVPYRDRFDELLEFVPSISKFLNRQSITHHIVVINQVPDGYRFNRGSIFNAGFHIIRKQFSECDYIALHDVDILPLTDEVSYAYPGEAVYHAIPPEIHPIVLYFKPTYFGGILLMPNEIFIRVNGFSNDFWGWSFEDTEFRSRVVKNNVPITRPKIFSTNRNNVFKHIHGKYKVRDVFYCPPHLLASLNPENAAKSGLHNVNYFVSSQDELIITRYPVYLFNINVPCTFEKTPWCKPFCRNNITILKTPWEWDENDIKNPQFKPLIELMSRFYKPWTEQ